MSSNIKRGPAHLHFPKKMQGGFTLIELLVVISIMGLMSSLVLSAVNDARKKARDTQRIQALGEIRKALTLYYDVNGYYPPSTTIAYSGASNNANWTNLATALNPYLSTLPKDPLSTAPGYYNIYAGTGTAYYGYGYQSNSRTGQPQDYDLITRFETSNALNCANKQWVSHAGSNSAAPATIGTVWCNPTGINATGNLYDVY